MGGEVTASLVLGSSPEIASSSEMPQGVCELASWANGAVRYR